jgi:hypothetical protein
MIEGKVKIKQDKLRTPFKNALAKPKGTSMKGSDYKMKGSDYKGSSKMKQGYEKKMSKGGMKKYGMKKY